VTYLIASPTLYPLHSLPRNRYTLDNMRRYTIKRRIIRDMYQTCKVHNKTLICTNTVNDDDFLIQSAFIYSYVS